MKAADSIESLRQRLAAAEQVCEVVEAQRCDNPDCESPRCIAIRTWQAFRG